MEKLKNKYLEIGELTIKQIKWINKEISETLDIDHNYYMYGYSFPDLKFIFFSFDCVTHEGPEQISFDEFKEIYESYKFVLPEKWCVKHYPETLKWIRENAEINSKYIEERNFYNFPASEHGNNSSVDILKGYTEITFEQFKEHVLKEKYHESEFNENPKEIIGYKLVKEEYEAEAVSIAHKGLKSDGFNKYAYGSNFHYRSEAHKRLEEAGVMHWFEPVYKPETITLKSGIELSESDIKELEALIEIRKICKSLANEN